MICKQLLLITGPTAIGKTEVALEVARKIGNVEIISVDSRQVYRHLNIGTAKPSQDQQAVCPHHFIDIIDPHERYSAGEFCRTARGIIGDIWANNGVPVLVGGTGLYWQSVLDGFFEDMTDYSSVREKLQYRLEQEGLNALYDELGQLDPIAQARIEPGDTQRVLRCLEVALKGGKTLSQLQQERALGEWRCRAIMVCLTRDRAKLHQRIDQRVEQMVKAGLVEEVEGLLGRGYDRETAALGTLGYVEIIDYLENRATFDDAKDLIKQRTRQFAKRQMTWFRRDRRLRFLDIGVWGETGVVERIEAERERGLS